jgi:flagellar FliL protein
MAEEPTTGENGDEDEEKTGGKSKLIIIIVVVLLLVGGGAGAYFAGLFGGGDEKKDEHAEHSEHDDHAEDGHELSPEEALAKLPVYFELPEFLVNLSSTGTKVSFLKMQVTMELRDQAALPVIEANKPRIVDTFNTYLRELRTSDLSGSAGIYRLREELMARVNKTVEPGVVKDILFSEIIVQ